MFLHICIILSALWIVTTSGNDMNEVKFTNLVCNGNPKYFVTPMYCRIKLFRNRTTALSIKAYPSSVIPKGFINLQFLKKANGYQPTTFNVTVDGCDVVQGNRFNPLLQIIVGYLKKSASMKLGCPVTTPLIFENFVFDISKIPSFIPPTAYLLKLHFFDNDPFIDYATVEVYISILAKRIGSNSAYTENVLEIPFFVT